MFLALRIQCGFTKVLEKGPALYIRNTDTKAEGVCAVRVVGSNKRRSQLLRPRYPLAFNWASASQVSPKAAAEVDDGKTELQMCCVCLPFCLSRIVHLHLLKR